MSISSRGYGRAGIRIDVKGLDDVEDFFAAAPDIATQAALMAINDTASGPALRMAREEILDEVNFPTGYLGPDRLGVAKKARKHDLEAVITGRDRPTSLARFAVNPKPGQRGVIVEVQKGARRSMKKGFIVKLRSGKTLDGETFNMGLAIRLAPGEKVTGRHDGNYTILSQDKNGTVVLLYGPSVDQVFRSVASDIAPDVGEALENEFFRQFRRLSKNA